MTLEDRIRAIPGEEGFTKPGAEQTYLKLALDMKQLGYRDNAIVDVLEAAYHAAASEFGA